MATSSKSWKSPFVTKIVFKLLPAGIVSRLGACVLLIQPKLGFDITGDIVLSADDQQKTALDVIEAFLQYKPAPTGDFPTCRRGTS